MKPPVSPLPLAGSLGPCLVSLGSLEPHNHTFMEPPLRLWRSQMIVVAWLCEFQRSLRLPGLNGTILWCPACDAARAIALIVWSFLRFPSLHTLSFCWSVDSDIFILVLISILILLVIFLYWYWYWYWYWYQHHHFGFCLVSAGSWNQWYHTYTNKHLWCLFLRKWSNFFTPFLLMPLFFIIMV